ncbi:hypothetical protein T265_10933 [Opisthorchis viverrini]|uniref:Uncharacterized protein n=1 Tax=Opisthorchis viverrini TaxID=6198 RepID=A0A074Z0H8_OPIVI|nr:hypothetical protein T265_10933 [Opisthorchis viverrini]KER20546.1 hypothetical protein T265_10933 [Opisthorchis viverrini]
MPGILDLETRRAGYEMSQRNAQRLGQSSDSSPHILAPSPPEILGASNDCEASSALNDRYSLHLVCALYLRRSSTETKLVVIQQWHHFASMDPFDEIMPSTELHIPTPITSNTMYTDHETLNFRNRCILGSSLLRGTGTEIASPPKKVDLPNASLSKTETNVSS